MLPTSPIFESLHSLELKAPLVLIELRARYAALVAGDTYIAKRLSQLEYTQPLMGDLLLRVLLIPLHFPHLECLLSLREEAPQMREMKLIGSTRW